MAKKPKVRWRLLATIICSCIAIFLVGCSMFSRKLLYFPTHIPLNEATLMAQRYHFEPWRNDTGYVIGWKQQSQTNTTLPRVLITHGNGGCAVFRVNYLDNLNLVQPCDVYILEYPGYGARPGSPTQTSFFNAADEAMGLLNKQSSGPIFIVGESLGTGVASYLAGKYPNKIAGILLFAPYHNLTDVAQHHIRILPAKWLLPDKFTSAEYLRNYHGPLAIVVGGRDTVVPARFGRRLFESYSGPKRLWEIPTAQHNDLPTEPVEWWRELVTFWKSSR
jgi:pimeloyl-ACP methyl ester carboxylesterase